MPHKRQHVNPRHDLAADREHLAKLRSIVKLRKHWVFATTNERAAVAFHTLAALLTMQGHSDLFAIDPELHVVPRGTRIDLTIVAIPKTVLTVDHVTHFLTRLTGDRPARLRASLTEGRDIMPVGDDCETIAGVIDQIVRGTLFVPDSQAN